MWHARLSQTPNCSHAGIWLILFLHAKSGATLLPSVKSAGRLSLRLGGSNSNTITSLTFERRELLASDSGNKRDDAMEIAECLLHDSFRRQVPS